MLTAIDHESNRYYVAEHYKESQPDRLHAAAYHLMLSRFKPEDKAGNLPPAVGIYADPGGAGSPAIGHTSGHRIYPQPITKDAGSLRATRAM